MKTQFFTAIILLIFNSVFSQIEIDSIIGYYQGIMKHTYGFGTTTTLQDTIIISNLDTNNCELLLGNFYWNGNSFISEYYTSYEFCDTLINPNEYGIYPYFYLNDSLEILNVTPQPYPYTILEEYHFKGKHIPGSSLLLNNNSLHNITRINISPNPASNAIHISLPGNLKTVDYNIYDIYGREQLSGIIKANENRIDISALPAGVYFIRFNAKDKVYLSKVVLQRE